MALCVVLCIQWFGQFLGVRGDDLSIWTAGLELRPGFQGVSPRDQRGDKSLPPVAHPGDPRGLTGHVGQGKTSPRVTWRVALLPLGPGEGRADDVAMKM